MSAPSTWGRCATECVSVWPAPSSTRTAPRYTSRTTQDCVRCYRSVTGPSDSCLSVVRGPWTICLSAVRVPHVSPWSVYLLSVRGPCILCKSAVHVPFVSPRSVCLQSVGAPCTFLSVRGMCTFSQSAILSPGSVYLLSVRSRSSVHGPYTFCHSAQRVHPVSQRSSVHGLPYCRIISYARATGPSIIQQHWTNISCKLACRNY